MRVSINDQILKDIADSIRTKTDTTAEMYPQDMASKIDNINVAKLQSKTVNITANGTQTVTPDSDYNGLSEVQINANVQTSISDYFPTSIDNTGSSNTPALFLKSVPRNITLSGTNGANMFHGCSNLASIPLLDTSSITDMSHMFEYCSSLTTIPLLNTSNVTNMNSMFASSGIVSVPLLDTSHVENMSYMFTGCRSLTTIPVLDTSNVTTMVGMFTSNANALTDESLNNVLKMCINAVNYNSYANPKKLTTTTGLGLNQYTYTQARVSALSNYQDFINAGWVW